MPMLGAGSLGARALLLVVPLMVSMVAAGPTVAGPPAANVDAVTVDVASAIRPADRRIVGINSNYLTDHADIRGAGQGYASALKELGVGSVRYPGGEEAEAYFWSTPPFSAPSPTLARTGPAEWPSNDPAWVLGGTSFIHRPLDFDELISYARAVGAEPTIMVAFDSMYKPAQPGGTAPTKATLLQNAVTWVRYANVTRGYGIKYWELGNESYKASYNGGAKAADYARDFVEFARAMKRVDPTIRVGANGPDSQYARGELDQSGSWWQTVLQVAAPDIDFLAVHSYPAWQWGGYDYYRTHTPNLTAAVDAAQAALAAWAPQHADRIRIRVTEIGSADWSQGGWPSVNNLGHAVVLFDQIGSLLLQPQVDSADVWTTRWVRASGTDLSNALDQNNNLTASGRSIAIWGQFLRASMVASTSTAAVRTYASYDRGSGSLSVFLINKDTAPRTVRLTLRGYARTYSGTVWSLAGTGPDDTAPAWFRAADVSTSDGSLSLRLAPVSITVVAVVPSR